MSAATVLVAALAVSAMPASATTPGHDGKIAFNRAGDIFTMNLDKSGLKRLTFNGGGNGWPSWSPDGTKIAWVHLGKVYIMDADGSNKHFFATGASPSWSPDGTTIAFTGHTVPDQDCGAIPFVAIEPVSGGTTTHVQSGDEGVYCGWGMGTDEIYFGHTTTWLGTHVQYGYLADDAYLGGREWYGFIDNDTATRTPTQLVQIDGTGPIPDVDTSPVRPNVVWTGDGGVQITRVDGTWHRTVVADQKAYAPKYDPANTAIFYSTRTGTGAYVIKRVGLAPGSTPTTFLTNASQPDIQPVS